MVSDYILFGHSGFIGSKLLVRLRAEVEPAMVRGLSRRDCDLAAQEQVMHAASQWDRSSTIVISVGRAKSADDSIEGFEYNVRLIHNLVTALREHPPKRIVYISTAGVYGEEIHNPLADEQAAVAPCTYYSLSKITCEQILSINARRLSVPLLILRPTWLYGPGDLKPYGPTAFLKSALAGESIVLWGDGSERRDFIHIDDVTEVACRLICSEHTGVVNIASGQCLSFSESIAAIEDAVGKSVAHERRERTKQKVDSCCCNARLREWVSNYDFMTLAEGLKRTVLYMRSGT